MTVDVLLALEGDLEAPVAALVDAERGAHLSRRCADIAEAVGAAEAGIGSVLVASESAQLDRKVVTRLAKHAVAVVAVARDAAGQERLAGRGCAAVLPPGATPEDVVAAALGASVARSAVAAAETGAQDAPSESDERSIPERRGAIVAVWGPQGAPGRTTIAANLAHELSTHGDTLLVDADTWGAAQAITWGLEDEAPGMAAVARAALGGELTQAVLARHAVELRPRLRLLTGLSRADRWAELAPAALDALWPLARASADVTVVDCGFGIADPDGLALAAGPTREEATAGILAEADLVVVVGGAEPLAMQRLVHALADLATVAAAAETDRMVAVNRVRAAVAGDRPREAVADVLAKYAQVAQVATVPHDQQALDACAMLGRTLTECAPRSQASRAVRDLAQQVAAHPAVAPAFASPRDAVAAA